jgi:protoporphyrinogen oxidase
MSRVHKNFPQNIILGGGMTGLAAGFVSGLPTYEAAEQPGGICASYYVRPGSTERLCEEPADGETYHFEIGGGHWIFGGDPSIIQFINSFVGCESYNRRSSVYFADKRLYVPYPLQNNMRFLDSDVVSQALIEMSRQPGACSTMKEWLRQNFGTTICELFFYEFHALYTAGLYDRIAPQDGYKSPVNISHAIQGAFRDVAPSGYNIKFMYPREGLNSLALRMANKCNIHYGKRLVRIDPKSRLVVFEDDSSFVYDQLISTLPLNKVMEISQLSVDCPSDPYTSVLVINIGAGRGQLCPDDHWLYTSNSKSGFHRVGFYSAVDRRFLPISARAKNDRVSIYVERAFQGGQQPDEMQVRAYSKSVVDELQEWGFITDAEVVDPTWIDVAYTWSWPNSNWKKLALAELERHNIFQVGRYGRWVFQGIADSIRDGFIIGSSFKCV